MTTYARHRVQSIDAEVVGQLPAVTVTISGTFRRGMSDIVGAWAALQAAGAGVLSPTSPRIVDALDDFVFIEGDTSNAVREVQARHLHAIERSNFVWLVMPDGYVGVSGAFEVAWAVRSGIPVFSNRLPVDRMLSTFVSVVGSERAAVEHFAAKPSSGAESAPTMALAPSEAADFLHRRIDTIYAAMTRRSSLMLRNSTVTDAAAQIRATIDLL